MKRKLLTKSLLLLLGLLLGAGSVSAGTVTIFDVNCSSTPEGWILTDGTATNEVQQTGYWLFDVGGNDYVITPSFNLSSYESATIAAEVATYGNGNNNPSAKIEVSYDGGTSFTEITTQGEPTSKSYVSISYSLNSVSDKVVIKVSNSINSGKALRFKNFKMTAVEKSRPSAPTFSPAAGAVERGTSVTLTAADGCDIYYTIDGTDPSLEGFVMDECFAYSTPIVINEETTIKAIAANSDDMVSEVSTASYTIKKKDARLVVASGFEMEVTTTHDNLVTSVESDGAITYSSSNTAVATVSSEGVVTALTIGTAVITVSVAETEDYAPATATISVTVTTKEAVAPVGPSGSGEGTYVLVTDASTLKAGDKILVVWKGVYEATSSTLTAHHAMGAIQNNNNRPAVEVTFSEDGNEITAWDGAQEITLEGSDNGWYFSVGDDSYLYAASNSSNQLKTNDMETVGDNGKAAISINATTNEATIKFQGANGRNMMRFNPNFSNNTFSPIFSCYSGTTTGKTPFIYRFEETVSSTYEVEITKNDWKSIVPAVATVFPTGISAYIVTGQTETSVTFTKVTAVAANTPVLLNGTNGTYTLTVADEETTLDNTTNNKLRVSTETTGNGVYVLATVDDKTCFYQWAGGALGAGRVYLPALVTGNSRQMLSINYTDVTGINVANNESSTMEVYDLQGRRVAQPARGLYIVNGKKVVLR